MEFPDTSPTRTSPQHPNCRRSLCFLCESTCHPVVMSTATHSADILLLRVSKKRFCMGLCKWVDSARNSFVVLSGTGAWRELISTFPTSATTITVSRLQQYGPSSGSRDPWEQTPSIACSTLARSAVCLHSYNLWAVILSRRTASEAGVRETRSHDEEFCMFTVFMLSLVLTTRTVISIYNVEIVESFRSLRWQFALHW